MPFYSFFLMLQSMLWTGSTSSFFPGTTIGLLCFVGLVNRPTKPMPVSLAQILRTEGVRTTWAALSEMCGPHQHRLSSVTLAAKPYTPPHHQAPLCSPVNLRQQIQFIRCSTESWANWGVPNTVPLSIDPRKATCGGWGVWKRLEPPPAPTPAALTTFSTL